MPGGEGAGGDAAHWTSQGLLAIGLGLGAGFAVCFPESPSLSGAGLSLNTETRCKDLEGPSEAAVIVWCPKGMLAAH